MAKIDYVVIGDTHECVAELRRLIGRIEKELPHCRFIHVGDYVDKGGATAEMVRFIHYRHYSCGDILVKCNHGNFVHGRITGELKALEDPVKEKLVFGSQAVFLGDEELKRMFIGLWADSIPYFMPGDWDMGQQDFFVTHAPCAKVYLGSTGKIGEREQRNYRVKDRTVPDVEDLNWFYEEADEKDLLHVFGHMAHSGKTLEECLYKNKLFLDTGCVYGNGLSAVHIRDGKVVKYYFESADKNRQPHSTLSAPLGLRSR